MSLKQIAPILLLILLNYSCSDECKDIECQNDGVCVLGTCECPDGFYGEFCENENLLLRGMYSNGSILRSYEYNDERQLISTTYHTDDEPSGIDTRTYYADSIIITRNYLNGLPTAGIPVSVIKYIKTPNNEIIYEIYDLDNKIINTIKYSLPNMDCGYELIEESEKQTTVTFTDENCSYLEELRQIGDTTVFARINYVKDNKNSAFTSTIMPFFSFPNTGNTTEITTFQFNTGSSTLIQYEYEYNDQDYPMKRIRTSNGSTSEITYEYY